MSRPYIPKKKEDFRKVNNMEEFNELIDSYVSTRQEFKNNINAAQGQARAKQDEITESTKPVVEAISNLRTELTRKPTYYSIFEKYANAPSKGSTEVRYERKGNNIIYKLGSMGEIDEAQIQDDLIHVTHMRTGEKMIKQLTPDLARLLFVPLKYLNTEEISASQLVRYYEILRFVGKTRGANNNRKYKIAEDAYNRVNNMSKLQRSPSSSKKERVVKVEEARQRVRERQMKEDEPKEEGTPAEDVYEEEEETPAVNLVVSRRKAGRKTRQSQRLKEIQKGYGLGRRKNMGRGFMSLDDMVSRLHLLASSMQGGNVSTQATNEMADIIDKLHAQGVLAKNDVKQLYEKYIKF